MQSSIVKHIVSTIKFVLGLKGVSVTESNVPKTNCYHVSDIEKKISIAQRACRSLDAKLKKAASGEITSAEVDYDAPLLEGYKNVFKHVDATGEKSYSELIQMYVSDLIPWPTIDYSYVYDIIKKNAESYYDMILVKAVNSNIITPGLLAKIYKQEWETLKADNQFFTDYTDWRKKYNGKDKESLKTDDDWQLKYFIHKFNLKYQFKRIRPVMRDILFKLKAKDDIYGGYSKKEIDEISAMDDKTLAKAVADKKEVAIFWSENNSTIKLLKTILQFVTPAEITTHMESVKRQLDEWTTFKDSTFKNVADDASMVKCLTSIIRFINKDNIEIGKSNPTKISFTITSPLFNDIQFPITIKNMITKVILKKDFKVETDVTESDIVNKVASAWDQFIIPTKYNIRSIEYYDSLASMLANDAELSESFFTYSKYLKYAAPLYIVMDTITNAIRYSTTKSLVIGM